LDSLKIFVNSKTTYVFDEKNSVEIGTNKFGQSVYDSVKIFSNPLFNQYGALNNEDSLYTAILPNNNAWSKIYDLVKSEYKTYGVDGKILQREKAQTALFQNLILRDSISNPFSLANLTFTSGNSFKNPGYLFDGSKRSLLSNGYAFITDSLRFKPEDTYQQKILVEAENSYYGRNTISANVYSRSALGTPFSSLVSDNNYILVSPATTNIESTTVTFPIPNTLSGKYNIYCVFVPSNIVDTASKRTYKVRFYLHYLNSNGVRDSAAVTVSNTLNSNKGAIAGIFQTKPSVITKQFVTQFTFPYCNVFSAGTTTVSTITSKLRVQNAANAIKDAGKNGAFDASLRIDCILLEPVGQ
jgi:hypothetical protein